MTFDTQGNRNQYQNILKKIYKMPINVFFHVYTD